MGWNVGIDLCRHLLKGVREIHNRGWMHRDITPGNLLFFQQPLRATLCDFGKLCRKATSEETALAAWIYLPPEIQPNKTNTYNQTIDFWLLAVALFRVWFPADWMGKELWARGLRDVQNHRLTHKLTKY